MQPHSMFCKNQMLRSIACIFTMVEKQLKHHITTQASESCVDLSRLK